MLNLATLKRQHSEISEILVDLKSMIHRNSLEEDALLIASKINLLAGKLKIHLGTEDKYMYPQLLESDNAAVKDTAKVYIDEMGHISKEFMDYKERFNTKTKIVGEMQLFYKETLKILEVLEQRVLKEDRSLYKYL